MVVCDEDIEDNQNNLIKIPKLFTMNRSLKPFGHFPRRSKSTSIVVPNPTYNLTDKYPNAREVRIRLVFIHIGKDKVFNFSKTLMFILICK